MNIPTCSKCRKPLGYHLRFCTNCGTFIDQKPGEENKPLHTQLIDLLGNDYQMMGELGRGGFAVVYSVRDRRTGQHLAVKVIRPEYATVPPRPHAPGPGSSESQALGLPTQYDTSKTRML